jgi:hypothetical protein
MSSSKHISIDIETAAVPNGDDYKVTVLSIGVVPFDAANGVREDEGWEMRLDLIPQILEGFRVDPATVAWWNEQSPDAIELAWGEAYRYHPITVLERLDAMIGGNTKVWAKGVRFDLNIIATLYTAFGMAQPWHFRNERCMRVLQELVDKTKFKQENELKHGALADAICQAHEIVAAKRYVGFWSTPKANSAKEQFLSKLREVGGEKAVNGFCKNNININESNYKNNTPVAILMDAFKWDKSPEKGPYWYDITNKLRNLEE